MLKKGGSFLCQRNRLVVYQFIDCHCQEFDLRWLLCKFQLSPNAYYNYRKNRKENYQLQKQEKLQQITNLYHKHDGIPGYRMLYDLLKSTIYACSKPTIYKFMKELEIRSVVMRRKPSYKKGSQHRLFENILQRDFSADAPNLKWCVDFIYLTLSNGAKRYNCSILDLYDRRIVKTLNSRFIDAKLAIDTPSWVPV